MKVASVNDGYLPFPTSQDNAHAYNRPHQTWQQDATQGTMTARPIIRGIHSQIVMCVLSSVWATSEPAEGR